MHSFGARVVSRCDELLGILAYKRYLVIGLLKGARLGRVAVLNIKTATEAHIPIVVPFVNVRKIRIAGLLLGNRCSTSTEWGGHSRCISSRAHVVCKRSEGTSATSPATSLTPAASTACIISTRRGELLLHRDGQLLYGWHLKLVGQARALRLGRRRSEAHGGHLGHDGCLVG